MRSDFRVMNGRIEWRKSSDTTAEKPTDYQNRYATALMVFKKSNAPTEKFQELYIASGLPFKTR